MGAGAEPPAPGRRPPWPYQGVVLLSVFAVLLVGGIGVGVWKLLEGDGGDDRARSDSTPSAGWPGADGVPSPSASPSSALPSAPSSASPSSASPSVSSDAGGGAPAGYVRTRDPEGFTLDVPMGWQRVKRDTGVFYESSDAGSLIQVFALTEPEITPYEALRQAESGLRKKTPGYHRYRLERLGPGDGADAELEYGYRSEKYGPRRILDRAFSGENGVQYAVLVAGPAEDWPEQRKRQTIVLDAFCPTAYCPAGSEP
ncbi:hypothetical protein JK363_01985 [Streptomyces sp. 205]|uniref:Serine/arginine repetitive matrix protein 2 n=1 Tax=Streptomyces coffeae TaxID=621382 RepID=A0ABS1N5X8_9ACTN|nr:hypothetical protein [Streptomyces coffeae]